MAVKLQISLSLYISDHIQLMWIITVLKSNFQLLFVKYNTYLCYLLYHNSVLFY